MASWTDGYVTDIQYTSGFYRELSPVYLAYVCDLIGVRCPDFSQPYAYCELGCGQGFGTNILAAANPRGDFYAYDFNPAQIANAQSLVKAAGLKNMHFFERSFQELAEEPRETQPTFDVIVFHGIISWIMPEHFQHIITFVERRLKPGGLVYVSYNSLPGWTAMAPLQRLLCEHAKLNPCRSDQQLKEAVTFANELQEAGAYYFNANPTVKQRMEGLAKHNINYLAHEYLNQAWVLFYFSDIARELDRAKLTFAGSAYIFDNFEILSIPEKVRPILEKTRDPLFAQTIRDYANNQQFRRDMFIRGLNRLVPSEQRTRNIHTLFQLLQQPAAYPIKFTAPLGEVTAKTEVYEPIIRALETKAMTLGELLSLPSLKDISFAEVSQSLALLVGGGYAHPITDRQGRDFTRAQALNLAVAQRVLLGANDYTFLSAPAVGTGVPANFLDMCILLTTHGKSGKLRQDDVAEGIWKLMEQYGRHIVQEGKVLNIKEEALPVISAQVEEFFEKRLSMWKLLGIL